MTSQKKKSKQLKSKKSFLNKIPVIKFVLNKWDFYKTIQGSLQWHHNEHDPKELARTTPPDSEKIELHCTWITEAYMPSNIDGLITTLKELGWDKPEKKIGNEESLIAWIKRGRSFSLGSFWKNGGIILSHNDNTRFFSANIRRSKLPKGVDYAYLSIHNVVSSLTLVTIQFVFNDNTAHSLDKPFKALFTTKVKYLPSFLKAKGATYVGVVEQKREALEKKKDAIHAELYSWVSINIPGYFSSLKIATLPTVDLITSRTYEQSGEIKNRVKEHYTDLLFDYGVEIWKCKTDPNLELRLPWRRTEKSSAVLFGNYDKLTQDMNGHDGRNRGALTNKFHTAFDMTMTLWSTHNLLLNYERELSAIRDETNSKFRGAQKAIKNLKFIRQHFLSISMDTQAVSNDIATLAKNKNRYSSNTLDFAPPHYVNEDDYPTFVELLRQQAEMRTEQLIKLELRVNEGVTASSNLLSAIANLNIQRNVFWFTVLAALLTLFSIFKN